MPFPKAQKACDCKQKVSKPILSPHFFSRRDLGKLIQKETVLTLTLPSTPESTGKWQCKQCTTPPTVGRVLLLLLC